MTRRLALAMLLLALAATAGCGSSSNSGGSVTPPANPAATPVIATAPAKNGVVIITLTDTTPGATIFYSVDGSAPTASSTQFIAPFLLASNATLQAVATASGMSTSAAASQSFTPNIASGTLVWSDEFNNSTGTPAQPDPTVWTYDSGPGAQCCGNNELENYCAWGSSTSPCDPANPNAYVGTDGYLHIVARQPSPGVYTSGRLKSQGLFSADYGRIEARMKLPEGQGMWPAFWMLGNSAATVGWPACGEQDIMEHINAPQPDWVQGSIHETGGGMGTQYFGANGQRFSAGDWHAYGMIWSPGQVQYYVDSPSNIYATDVPSSVTAAGAVWAFDQKYPAFIILNLAVGGDWPGSPDATTPFPSETLVDYVRVYTN